MNADLIGQLDAGNLDVRLKAVASLRDLEIRRKLDPAERIGPVLPSYDHIHTTASYGSSVPGVFSVSRMIWAAHEARARSTLLVEHESTVHFEEAARAVAIVNQGMTDPLRLILAVEFKAPIAKIDAESRRFGEMMGAAWGQDEAAWVVGVGATPSAELSRLVAQFQKAKRVRAGRQFEKLNRHLGLIPPLALSSILTPEDNITDRSLSMAFARAEQPTADPTTLFARASTIRKMLNPGGPAYAPYPKDLPSYQEVTRQLLNLGMTPTFTAQLRGETLASVLPLLKSWGMRGLDVAGIEPSEPNVEQSIHHFIDLATQHQMALFGGADYRGTGTGWITHERWMDHPLIRASSDALAKADAVTVAPSKPDQP